MHTLRRVPLLTIFLPLVTLPALAQTAGTGALTASVTDPSGAMIAGANVTVSRADTGLTRTQTTDATGTITFTLLPPGDYDVNFAATGFNNGHLGPVTVNVTETRVITERLTVGAQQQEVTVEAAVQTVQTENSTLGGVVGHQAISDLPLVSRNFTQIMALSPGVNAGVTNAAALGRGFVSFYTNGQNEISNTYQIDGVTVNNFGGGAASGGTFFGEISTPSPDALQEFKVQTAQYDASYGRNAGAQVNIITRSGSNEIHGSLFEFFRNEKLNANSFFNNRSGLPRGILRQNQYGGTVGGRIIKDKLFYFISYQGTRQLNGIAASGSSSVNYPYQLTNDRSAAGLGAAFCPANNSLVSTVSNASPTQVACNGSNINQIALNLLNFKLSDGTYAIPTPQTILNAGTRAAVGFGAYSQPASFKENQVLGNLDYVLSSKNSLAFKFQYAIAPQVGWFTAGQPPGAGSQTLSGSQLESIKLTSVITNHLVNEARASLYYLRASNSTTDQVMPSKIGMTPLSPEFNVMPIITMTGLFSFGGGSTDGSRAPQQTYEYSDQLSWNRGRHTIRTGINIQRIVYNINVTGIGRGTLTFNTFSDFLLGQSAAQNGSTTGLSNLQSVSGTYLPPGGALNLMRANQASSFVQDDYKVNPKLTLNLGVRWEYAGTGYDVDTNNGGGNPNWGLDQSVSIPPASGTYVGYTVANNFTGTVPDGVVRRPLNLLTTGHAPFTNFGPRFGFAYQPLGNTGRFVVRGGFGGFFQTAQGNIYLLELNNNPPISTRISRTGSNNGQSTFANPYTPPATRGFINFLRTPSTALAQSMLDANLLTPITYAFNLNFQYAISHSLFAEVGYVGTRGEHIITGTTLNTPQIATASNPVNCNAPSGCITTNTAANAQQRVPVIGLATNGVSYGTNAGDSVFHSLQATLRSRAWHGLTGQMSYTWGKTMTDVAGTSFVGGYAGTVTSNGPDNRAQQSGRADFDRAQRVVLNYSYQAPSFKQGKGIAGHVLSDWGVSGVTIMQSGQPITFTDPLGGGILNLAGSTSSRAQLCPGMTTADILTSGPISSRLNGFYNLNAFADTLVTGASAASKAACPFPTVGVVNGVGGATGFGNTGRALVTGPGQFNWDLAITKNIKTGGLRESATLQFRAEMFNAFNHPQFSNPASAVVNASAFGQITTTSVAPRIMQMALRYTF
jgi:hypothetical protein